jgi:hypothetical protein
MTLPRYFMAEVLGPSDPDGRLMKIEMQLKKVFTQGHAWSGGSYELGLEMGPVDDDRLCEALQILWSFPDLVGCYLENNVGPDDQPRVDFVSSMIEERSVLYGLATLPPRQVSSDTGN